MMHEAAAAEFAKPAASPSQGGRRTQDAGRRSTTDEEKDDPLNMHAGHRLSFETADIVGPRF